MTNRISLYISADSDLSAVRNLAKREQAAARNVKSDWVRTEVQAAWRNVLVYLSELRKIPEKGLILFASSDGVESIEPPVPNRSNIYRCGSDFYREPLDAMHDEAVGEKYGLILIDSNGGSISWYRGETVISLWEDDSQVMGKHKMGGASSARFQRGHEQQLKQWIRKVADKANQIFLDMKITKILVGGPGHLKRAFVEDGRLDYRFQVIGFTDCGYTDAVVGSREALARWRASTNL